MCVMLRNCDEVLGLGGPAVVGEPAPDDDGDEADEQGEDNVDLGVACKEYNQSWLNFLINLKLFRGNLWW